MLKIAVVSGSRAEYGHLFWLLQAIESDPECELKLYVTGSHLDPNFGNTSQEISKDGFHFEEVPIDLSGDSRLDMIRATTEATRLLSERFSKDQIDLLLVLGDRTEAFAAAQAAVLLRVPIVHLHGGEITEGAVDNVLRHCLTKMASLHFTAAEPYHRRVIQMGEDPKNVFNVGAIGLDHLHQTERISQTELSQILKIDLKDFFLITYHPSTLLDSSLEGLQELLSALEGFPDVQLIFTKSNSDAGGRAINQKIEQFVERKKGSARLMDSFGLSGYYSAVENAQVVIGNSSSGLIEVPHLGKPTVNIGDRQKGRLLAPSVISCGENREEIQKAISKSLTDEFQSLAAKRISPYLAGNISPKVLSLLKDRFTRSKGSLIQKRFYDVSLH